MKSYKCPECGERIQTLHYTANCSETQYGRSNGTYKIGDQDACVEDTDYNDSDNFEEDEFEYECPECEACIDDPDELEEWDEPIEEPIPYEPPKKNNYF